MPRNEDLFLVFLKLEQSYGEDYLIEKMQTYLLRKECRKKRKEYMSEFADNCKVKDCKNCLSEYPEEQRTYCYIHLFTDEEPTE